VRRVGDLRAAIGFLTLVPGGGVPTPGARRWFPLVGAGVGAALGALWTVADQVWPPLLAAVVVVAADLAVTGMLHLDGVADTADGLLPHATPRRRLEVMADPRSGAFAIAAVATVLTARLAAFASLAPSPGLMVGLWAASRGVASAVPAVVDYARGHGTAAAMHGGGRGILAIASLAAAGGTAIAAADRGLGGAVAVPAGVVAAVLVVAVVARRIGGYTGDVLGAAIVAAETTGLVVAAARW
jgi:adenosylcobinamide-GDP ribazoletransferase